MWQSELFGGTMREAPKDEVVANAKLLERGGFVHKTMAGVYDWLPLGLRVLNNINAIIREEINAIGGVEVFLSALQPKERWEKTARWEALADIMYQFKDHSGRDIGLAVTHEEAVAEIAMRFIHSYKDLPRFIYQIQTKFRDEPRAKSGMIRGREFLMKDLYSFHRDEADLKKFYARADKAYRKIFTRCGVDALVAEASGGTFTKSFSHEYQAVSEAGEDFTLYCEKCRYAQNKEISALVEGERCPKCDGGVIRGAKTIEVGNIFKLGTKFSEAFGVSFADEEGEKRLVVMGCYGIGPGRLLGTIVEMHHDERGLVWPEAVAPFRVHILALLGKEKSMRQRVAREAEKLYKKILAKGVAVLYDERGEASAGEKFADADLIGIPWRIVVSEKTCAARVFEVKRRSAAKVALMSGDALMKKIVPTTKRRG